jgi:transcription antitermination factor NusG
MHDIDALERLWFAVFTAANNEKKIEQHIKMKNIETFLPLYTATRHWKNRTTAKVQLPLFAGYVFARFARQESSKILDIPMVYSIVGNRAGALPLPAAEIEALRSGLVPSEVEPFHFTAVGQRARIRSGPLADWEGVVSRLDGGVRVVLSVDLIKQSVSVKVNVENLELLPDPVSELGSDGPAHSSVSVEQA